MGKLKNKEINEEIIHDFSAKLRQKSAIDFLRRYISWQRNCRSGKIDFNDESYFPNFCPLSINLDLTTSCNFRCPFCVDSKILNQGKQFNFTQIVKTIETLSNFGLKSVLLIGGGEPTLHPDFVPIVRFLKKKKLQVGIITNGSRLSKVKEIAEDLESGDWVRLSLDAGSNETFQLLHKPVFKINLQKILSQAKEVRKLNSSISLGLSYVVIWEGIKFNGIRLQDNVEEIHQAVKLAIDYEFDYISFKPCLLKSEVESITHCETEHFVKVVSKRISDNLEKAKEIAHSKLKVIITLNMQAILNGRESLQRFKCQPQHCHIQLFRQIVTPIGIFHCPAFRGDQRAQIGEALGCLKTNNFLKVINRNYQNLLIFNAQETCKDIACFYNKANNWIEEFIESGKNVSEIEPCQDHNFFL